MKETIYTIPINDIFNEKDGCPICKIKSMLEQNFVQYIVGDAMMEPSIRVIVNQKGFCNKHFNDMLKCGSKLPIALMLESHLQEIIESQKSYKNTKSLKNFTNSCFVCDDVEKYMDNMLQNIIKAWHNEADFRNLYKEQKFICAEHCYMLLDYGSSSKILKLFERKEFLETTHNLMLEYLKTLKADISHFCQMYDYRNRGGDWGNSKDSIERSVDFLTTTNH